MSVTLINNANIPVYTCFDTIPNVECKVIEPHQTIKKILSSLTPNMALSVGKDFWIYSTEGTFSEKDLEDRREYILTSGIFHIVYVPVGGSRNMKVFKKELYRYR